MSTVQQFEHELQGQARAIESMLPAGLDMKRFMRTTVNTVMTHPQADRLLGADRQSLFSACQKAAGDGLLLDGREATLVVFRDNKTNTEKITYMPMVQGLVKLARNSNEISKIVAEVVYSKDRFTYRPGLDDLPVHEPDWFGDRGDAVGAYAVVTTRDGECISVVLPKKRIVAIGQGGRNGDQYVPGKGAHFAEWWKKTVIKNVLKYSPKSTHLESAMAADNELIDPDKIPATEKVINPANDLKALLNQQGESVTVRTESEQPSGRRETDRPDGEKLTGTESTSQRVLKQKIQQDIVNKDSTADRIRQKLHEQKQVPVSEPDDVDQETLKMAIDSMTSCRTLDELEQCGEDLQGMIHPDLKDKARAVFKEMMKKLSVQ